MNRAIRIKSRQALSNFRKPASFLIKETYPLPPYSTIIGMVHTACDFERGSYHQMEVSVQGVANSTISDLYTRYSFNAGASYEADRHQIQIKGESKNYGVFKGVANIELICELELIIHIKPTDNDFEAVLNGLRNPKRYPALGRHEDLLDIFEVKDVSIEKQREVYTKYDIYVPLKCFKNSDADANVLDKAECRQEGLPDGLTGTLYSLNKEFIIKDIRVWKEPVKAVLIPKGDSLDKFNVDEDGFPVAFA